jgi:hypothetical protein
MLPPPASMLEDLVQQLHQANARFHDSKVEWEKWLLASEYRHEERVEAAREQLRAAEQEIEAIEERIKKALERGGNHQATMTR